MKKEVTKLSRYSGFESQIVDNGILFIIALFFLSCAGCGTRGNFGGGCGSNYRGY